MAVSIVEACDAETAAFVAVGAVEKWDMDEFSLRNQLTRIGREEITSDG